MNDYNFREKAKFIWSIGSILRGDYKANEFGKVILPLTVLRRMDCTLSRTKKEFIQRVENGEHIKLVSRKMNLDFYNTSKFNFENLKDDANNIALNLINYIDGFSENAKEILEYFNFNEQIDRLDRSNILYLIITKFSEIDLHPSNVSNLEMGYIFEELIRKFSEQSNEDAGEHFSPREIIRLMVNLLFIEDKEVLKKQGIVRTLYDPAAGTGGMLSVAKDYLYELNPSATLNVFGQELNPESYAICKADMMIKGENASNIKFGNSFSEDGFQIKKFDYMLSNPPFGVDWKKVENEVRSEHEQLGFAGRFGAGLPRIDNGSFLFLQHMISKMKSDGDGSRIAVVYNGGTLFVADHASGDNNIRRWIIENDWLEAIVALPNQLFYNVGFNTYIWIISNKKSNKRKGKVQLINAINFYEKMRRSLGNKRNRISNSQIEQITKIYEEFKETEYSKIIKNDEMAYKQFTIELPQRRNFSTDEIRLGTLIETKAYHNIFKKMSEPDSVDFLEILRSIPQDIIYRNKNEFKIKLSDAIEANKTNYKLSNLEVEKIILYLSEIDQTADVYTDSNGSIKSDTDQRLSITVPADIDISAYFKKEFLDDYPDSLYDEDKIKIVYTINFDKYFFKYKQLDDMSEIKERIAYTENSIVANIRNIKESIKTNSYEEYKDSKLESIGEIPIEWDVVRFRKATKVLRTGYSKTPEYVGEDDDSVAFLSAQNIKNGKLDLNKYNFISRELYENITKTVKPQKGDLLQVRVGNENTIAETCIMDEDFEYAVYVSASHIRAAENVYPEYLMHICNSLRFKEEARMTMKIGVDIANLNITDLANIKIPLPSYDEQISIANYLDSEIKKINDTIGVLQEQINNLENYKQSLVEKCISGKIKIKES